MIPKSRVFLGLREALSGMREFLLQLRNRSCIENVLTGEDIELDEVCDTSA
jgi:hypothetical protein